MQSITFAEDFKDGRLTFLKTGVETTIEFKPGVNIISGKNGVGKTTLFDFIHKALFAEDKPQRVTVKSTAIPHYSFNMTKLNPALRLANKEFDPIWFHRKFSSHGESNTSVLEDLYQISKEDPATPKVFFVDEPELALDFVNLTAFIKHIKATQSTRQYIIASHHPLLILNPKFNHIELSPNYLELVKTEMVKLHRLTHKE